MDKFKLKSKWQPAGDQPKAIKALVSGLKKGEEHQTLLGVTGSGKTFTVANVINEIQKPTLVIAHNKTLAAQLAQEYRDFFPENEVHYFVSYYDYYQPEAYVAVTDTYIEKDASINEEIDRLRHASTQALLTRNDVIIVASVSCIYGLGSPAEYKEQHALINVGQKISRTDLIKSFIRIFYERTNADLSPGEFRSIGNMVELMPASAKEIIRLTLSSNEITAIDRIDAVSRAVLDTPDNIFIFPAKHFVTDEASRKRALKDIEAELKTQLKKLQKSGRNLEAERLKRRTNYDLAMIREIGYCGGIENYSRHLSGKAPGEAPDTLLSYFPHKKDGSPDFLTVIDESHVTVPQIGGMYAGDRSRKETLVEFGFRLPSALDNRPLRFEEFAERVGQTVYTSATPGTYELEKSGKPIEQIIRPTGLLDPEIEVRPIVSDIKTKYTAKPSTWESNSQVDDRPTARAQYRGQVKDFIEETNKEVKKGGRVIATTLTKKMAEDLSDFLKERRIKAEYLHSEIKTLERIQILTDFRKGKFDCLVGVNLLREGLDLPEVTFIGILDADKEGFLRSEVSLIQTIGRAARNVAGRVILYADNITGSMKRAIDETSRRRTIQEDYNKKHGITPQTIIKRINDITETLQTERRKAVLKLIEIEGVKKPAEIKKLIKNKEKEMNEAVKTLDFETAAILRDEIKELTKLIK